MWYDHSCTTIFQRMHKSPYFLLCFPCTLLECICSRLFCSTYLVQTILYNTIDNYLSSYSAFQHFFQSLYYTIQQLTETTFQKEGKEVQQTISAFLLHSFYHSNQNIYTCITLRREKGRKLYSDKISSGHRMFHIYKFQDILGEWSKFQDIFKFQDNFRTFLKFQEFQDSWDPCAWLQVIAYRNNIYYMFDHKD